MISPPPNVTIVFCPPFSSSHKSTTPPVMPYILRPPELPLHLIPTDSIAFPPALNYISFFLQILFFHWRPFALAQWITQVCFRISLLDLLVSVPCKARLNAFFWAFVIRYNRVEGDVCLISKLRLFLYPLCYLA